MKSNVLLHIAGRLAALRQARGLTAQDLAAKAGVPLANVVGIEAAERWPGAAELSGLCSALGVTPLALFADEGTLAARVPGLSEANAGYAHADEIVRLVSAFDAIAEVEGRVAVIELAESLGAYRAH